MILTSCYAPSSLGCSGGTRLKPPRLRLLVRVERPSIALELCGQPVQPRVPAGKGYAREIASPRPVRRELLEPSCHAIGLGGHT